MRKDRDLLVPTAKVPYKLSYATTVVAYYKLAALRFVTDYKRFSLIAGSQLLYVYVYIPIFICIYAYIYIDIYVYI